MSTITAILVTLFGSAGLKQESGQLYPEFPEFITREGQPLTPHIIPSASS